MRSSRLPRCATTALAAVTLFAGAVTGTMVQAQTGDGSDCRAIADSAARLRCYETLRLPSPSGPPAKLDRQSQTSRMIGRWRLVRSASPNQGHKDAISITHSGELSGSDPDFAGLMVRCGDVEIEVLIVLLRPLPARARPQVSINGQRFESTVVQPGVSVVLPPEVARLAVQAWPQLPSVTVAVEEAGKITKGVVLLDDYRAALTALTAVCTTR